MKQVSFFRMLMVCVLGFMAIACATFFGVNSDEISTNLMNMGVSEVGVNTLPLLALFVAACGVTFVVASLDKLITSNAGTYLVRIRPGNYRVLSCSIQGDQALMILKKIYGRKGKKEKPAQFYCLLAKLIFNSGEPFDIDRHDRVTMKVEYNDGNTYCSIDNSVGSLREAQLQDYANDLAKSLCVPDQYPDLEDVEEEAPSPEESKEDNLPRPLLETGEIPIGFYPEDTDDDSIPATSGFPIDKTDAHDDARFQVPEIEEEDESPLPPLSDFDPSDKTDDGEDESLLPPDLDLSKSIASLSPDDDKKSQETTSEVDGNLPPLGDIVGKLDDETEEGDIKPEMEDNQQPLVDPDVFKEDK